MLNRLSGATDLSDMVSQSQNTIRGKNGVYGGGPWQAHRAQCNRKLGGSQKLPCAIYVGGIKYVSQREAIHGVQCRAIQVFAKSLNCWGFRLVRGGIC